MGADNPSAEAKMAAASALALADVTEQARRLVTLLELAATSTLGAQRRGLDEAAELIAWYVFGAAYALLTRSAIRGCAACANFNGINKGLHYNGWADEFPEIGEAASALLEPSLATRALLTLDLDRER